MPDDPSIRPETPLAKGIPAAEIIKLWEPGFCYGGIQRRYPQLTWADINEVVHGKTYSLVQARLAEGKTTADIARELRCSPANVRATKQRMERNKTLRRDWGGLSPRAVKMLKKLGYKGLHEILKDPPSEEKIFRITGVGRYTFHEIKNIVHLKPSPRLFGSDASPAISSIRPVPAGSQ